MSLFSSVADFLKPPAPLDRETSLSIDQAVELIDPMLIAASNLERRLAEPIEFALAYCRGLVAALPGPINISRQAFSSDPLVHAMFATADDIMQTLGRSQAVRDFLAEPGCWESEHFYAMFVARRNEKRQLGMVQVGEVIQNDVPQTVLYFTDQTLIEPSVRLDETLANLRSRAMESLFKTFRAHVELLRDEREGLRADLSLQRAHVTVLRGKTAGHEVELQTRHLDELDARLREHVESLMPDQLVDALADFLKAPELALDLRPVEMTIDQLGVVHDNPEDKNHLHTINFPELIGRDMRHHLAMLARISRDEALEAVTIVRDQQHRFMLI